MKILFLLLAILCSGQSAFSSSAFPNSSSSGGGSGNVTDINSDVTPSQTLTVGSTGTDFAIVDDGSGGHAFNIPSASATARGLVKASGAQTLGVDLTLSGAAPVISALTASKAVCTTAGKALSSSCTVANTQGGTGGDSSGGTGLAKVAAGTWSYATLLNADVNASAAIDYSKLATLTGPVTISGNVSTFVDAYVGHVPTAGNVTYVIDECPAFASTINSMGIGTSSGTITCALKINGTNVTSLSAVSVTSTAGITSATGANTVSTGCGNPITLVCSSNSSALDLAYTIKITR